MVKLVKYMIVICTILLLTACPEPAGIENDAFLKIVNNSEEDILWLFDLEGFEWYKEPSADSWIETYDNRYVLLRGGAYIKRFNSEVTKENLRRGWIKYYLFNLDSGKTIPWKRICDERILLKEITFNRWEDFEACHFMITYP